jgi:hypothetical protein
MATVVKDFKVKNGLIVEGTTGTINNFDILTKSSADQTYITNLVGGTGTALNTPDTLVKRDGSGNFAAGTITANLTGNVTGTVSDISNHDTDDLDEGTTNKYFTDSRAKTSAAELLTGATLTNITITGTGSGLTITAENGVDDSTTDDLDEGTTNLYYTNQRVDDYINASIDTDDISEGATNKYFTEGRVHDALSAGDGLDYNSTTGEFSADLGYGLQFDGSGQIEVDGSVIATDQNLSDAIDAHNVSSGVHGVTGDVVGTTDSQTLSNKTLGSNLDAGTHRITNLSDPSSSSDAATKAYVDSYAEGLHIHASAVAATTTNISIANDLMVGDTIDGVNLASGNRVLVKNQTNAAENGIYEVQPSGSALRAADFDAPAEVNGGDFIFVTGGNANDNTGWVQTSTGVVTIGTDPITFTQFSGAGTYLAGNGLDLNGNTFEIDETVVATRTWVGEELDAHVDLESGVHGVTGDVVGTSDTQTLTNKTLGSGTVLGANLDATNTYKVTNLVDPTSNQDAATKKYVDDEVSDVAGDLTTHQNATTGIHGVTGNIVGTSDSQTLTNKTIDGSSNTLSNIANASLVNDSVTVNGNEVELGSSITLDTDDVAEGTTNKYFTDNRAKDAAGYLLENASQTNIAIVYDEVNRTLSVTAENGVADSDTDDLAEGTSNLYFTDQRAIDALEGVTPNFPAVEIDSVAKQVAAEASVPTASTSTAVSWAKADYRSAEFLVKFASGSHTEIAKVLLTMDTSDNIAITEYAIVGTNGDLGSISADVNGNDVRLRVTTVNNNSTVAVVGTLLK